MASRKLTKIINLKDLKLEQDVYQQIKQVNKI